MSDTRIDVFNHCLPRRYGYRQILNLSSPAPEAITTPGHSPELARIGNEAMADWCACSPDHFPGFVAALPLNHPDAALEEANFAITQLGALGVQLYTSVNGLPLDQPEFLSLFELAAGFNENARRLLNLPET